MVYTFFVKIAVSKYKSRFMSKRCMKAICLSANQYNVVNEKVIEGLEGEDQVTWCMWLSELLLSLLCNISCLYRIFQIVNNGCNFFRTKHGNNLPDLLRLGIQSVRTGKMTQNLYQNGSRTLLQTSHYSEEQFHP